MRLDTVTTEVYTFDELAPDVQRKIIDRHRYSEDYPSWEWWDCDYENFIENHLHPAGFDATANDIYFSGFSSQGDGACFDGKLDVQQYIEHFKLQEKYPLTYQVALKGYCWGRICKNSYATYYSHEKTRYIEIEDEGENAIRLDVFNDDEEKYQAYAKEVNEFEKSVEDERYDLCRQLYRTLEKSYDDLMSDETIIDEIKNNNDEFTKDGKIY